MEKPATYNKKVVFAAACTGMLLFGISMISLGTILPGIIEKFLLTEKATGSLVALLPIGLLAGSLVFGPIIDRYGYKYLMIICSLLILFGLEGVAYCEGLLPVQISVFFIGAGGGVLNGTTNALVNDISEEDRRANLSFLGVFFGVGALGMPSLIGILSTYFIEKNIIAGIGIALVIPTLFFLLIRFPFPDKVQSFPIRQGLKLLKNPILIISGMILFFESGIEGIINNWTTTYLQRSDSLNNQEALFALSAFVFSLSLSRLILGFLLKKVSSSYILLAGIAITASGLILLNFTTGFLISVAGLFLLGIGCAALFPVILSYVGELFSEMPGTAFSIVMVIAVTGNIIINYIMGLSAHQFGISHYTSVLMISLLSMMVFLFIALRMIRPHIKN